VSFLQNNPHVSVVGSNLIYLNEKSEQIGEADFPTDSDEIARTLLYKNCIAHPSVAFRKNALIECGLYSEFAIGAEDYDLWLRMISNGKLIMSSPEKLTSYRIHTAQVSREKLKRQTIKILTKSQIAAAQFLNEPMLGIRGRIYLFVKNSFISKFISVSTKVVALLRRH
jgi:GT2 family glycosyltransferase